MFLNVYDYFDELYRDKRGINKIKRQSKEYLNHRDTYKLRVIKLAKKLGENISSKYIHKIVEYEKNKCYIQIENSNIVGLIIYKRIMNNRDKKRYVIQFFAVSKCMRHNGIGSKMLDNLCSLIKNSTKKKIEIILHSVKSAQNFYLNFGFKEIEKNVILDNLESVSRPYFPDGIMLLKYVL